MKKNYNLYEEIIHHKGESALSINRKIDTLGTQDRTVKDYKRNFILNLY